MHAEASVAACRQQGRLTVTTVSTARQARAATSLIAEYIDWIERRASASARDVQGAAADDLRDPVSFFEPPAGALLVARDGSSSVGVVGVHRHDDGAAEVKRMYVRPWARRLGVGEALLHAALLAARRLGATRVVLETHPTHMPAAVRLYRRAGFVEAAPLGATDYPGILTLQRQL
jgi:ribosomal protein S18 acetylase RimI-like enzyme